MNRRNFLGSLFGGVAAAAAVRTWPFRVFSFPSEIAVAPPPVAIKFIRSFDPTQNRMVNRWDMLMGFAQLEALPVDGEVINVKCWDSMERKLIFDIPGRSKEPFIGIIPSGN